jgi:hypothetical protein
MLNRSAYTRGLEIMTDTTVHPSEQLVLNAMTTLAGLLRANMYDYDRTATMYPESQPSEAHRYGSSDELIRDARRYGHFFDEPTMRTFKTKTYDLFGGRFLVISDKSDWAPRDYRVVWLYQHKPTCDNAAHIHKSVETTETRFSSLAKARKFAQELAELTDLIAKA